MAGPKWCGKPGRRQTASGDSHSPPVSSQKNQQGHDAPMGGNAFTPMLRTSEPRDCYIWFEPSRRHGTGQSTRLFCCMHRQAWPSGKTAHSSRPRWILLENVIGFERSECRRCLLSGLAGLGWQAAEFALDPQQFGLPNRRPRYYGLFRMPLGAVSGVDAPGEPPNGTDGEGGGDGEPEGQGEGQGRGQGGPPLPQWRAASELLHDGPDGVEGRESEPPGPALLGGPELGQPGGPPDLPPPLGNFLQPAAALALEEVALGLGVGGLEVAQSLMSGRVTKDGRYDLHLRSDRTSACLTKSNGRLPRGLSPLVVLDEAEAGALDQRPKISAPQDLGPSGSTYHVWRPGVRVRYLSPREQLRLMGYPESYTFPPGMPFRDQCALVGNSLNVRVVTWLLHVLLASADVVGADLVRGRRGLRTGDALAAAGWGPRERCGGPARLAVLMSPVASGDTCWLPATGTPPAAPRSLEAPPIGSL